MDKKSKCQGRNGNETSQQDPRISESNKIIKYNKIVRQVMQLIALIKKKKKNIYLKKKFIKTFIKKKHVSAFWP